MAFSPEQLKRRTLFKTGVAVVGSLVLFGDIPKAGAETDILAGKKKAACTFHGINGSPNDGIIGDLNFVLRTFGYDVHSPQMPREGFPIKEEWDFKAEKLLNDVNPDITFWYSLAVRTMLRVGTRGNSPMGTVVSLAGRRPDVDINQFHITDPRHDFYDGGVDLNRFVANTQRGRYCFNTSSDNNVKPKENAPQLAAAIQANATCDEVGQGHFDIPGKTLEFAQGIVDVSRRWGILG